MTKENHLKDNTFTKFLGYVEPALYAGKYTITATQTVSGSKFSEEKHDDTKNFVVKGKRFSLTDDDIHHLYPPANSMGDYSASLAHVVFKSPSFPWQRFPGEVPESASETGFEGTLPTWLGVLLFNQNDPVPDQTRASG